MPQIMDEEIEILEDVTNGDSGTLVIWEKVDRLLNKDYTMEAYRRKAFDKAFRSVEFGYSREGCVC